MRMEEVMLLAVSLMKELAYKNDILW